MDQSGDILRFGVAATLGGTQTVAGDGGQNGLHIVWHHHVTPLHPGPGARGGEQAQSGAGRQTMQEGRLASAGFDQRLHIVDQRRRGMDGGCGLLQRRKMLGREHWLQCGCRCALVACIEQGALGAAVGITEFEAHQKAVELRFRQGEGADLVRRILRGDDEEGGGQRPGFAVGCDLAFLHRFEQGALGLGGGAVDFIGQNHLGENRAGQKTEIALFALVDGNAGNVGRQQVAGELDAGKLETEQAGQGLRQGGLAHARQVFDEQVAAGEKTGQGQADFPLFAENDPVGGSKDSVERVFGRAVGHETDSWRWMGLFYAVGEGGTNQLSNLTADAGENSGRVGLNAKNGLPSPRLRGEG
ncbi:MAG: hypothetical protein BWY57_02319 [Betaproteobacteria bacterium ADurb.Bin341]|nr:MAG: hypothetical protein BWY57_02319 [Betaproteobacteria bacterium ADurb.Bin341]